MWRGRAAVQAVNDAPCFAAVPAVCTRCLSLRLPNMSCVRLCHPAPRLSPRRPLQWYDDTRTADEGRFPELYRLQVGLSHPQPLVQRPLGLNTRHCAITLAAYPSRCLLAVMYTAASVPFQWTTPPHRQSSKGLRSPPLARREVSPANHLPLAADAGGVDRGPLPRHHPAARRPKPRPAAAAAGAGHPHRLAARPSRPYIA